MLENRPIVDELRPVAHFGMRRDGDLPQPGRSSAVGLSDVLVGALPASVWQRYGGAGLPLGRVAVSATRDESVHYVTTTVDNRGRLSDRSPLRVLGWGPHHPVALSVLPGLIVVDTPRSGRDAVTRQGHLRLPAYVRHRCRIHAGDRVLVLACPEHDTLIIYTLHVLDQMVLAYHTALAKEEG